MLLQKNMLPKVVVWFVFACLSCCAQLSYSLDIRFESIKNRQLNSLTEQRAIIQDPLGFMWFGGVQGLARYDGYEFKRYSHKSDDPRSLSNNAVTGLMLDNEGELWVATANGLNRYHTESEDFTRYVHDLKDPDSLPNKYILGMLQDRRGAMWFGVQGGMSRLDLNTGKFHEVPYPEHQPLEGRSGRDIATDPGVLFEDSQGMIWAGRVTSGLLRFDPNTLSFKNYRHDASTPTSLSHNDVSSIYEDSDNQLWIGTWQGGLNRFDRETETFTHYRHDANNPQSLGYDEVHCLLEDEQNNFWVGTERGGLNRLNRDTGEFDRILPRAYDVTSIASDKIWTCYQDNYGGLWFGLFPFGVSMVNDYALAFDNYTYDPADSNSLSDNQILSLAEAKSGDIWVGTENGLNYIDRKTGEITRYLHRPSDPAGLAADAILALMVDRQGALWVGSYLGGLSRLDPETRVFTHYMPVTGDDTSLGDNRVTGLYQDSRGDIWIGTFTGINRLRVDAKGNAKDSGRGFTRYNHEPGNSQSMLPGVAGAFKEDSRGNFWIGSYLGLSLMDRDRATFQNFQYKEGEPEGLGIGSVHAILEDKDGLLWLGLKGGGLNRLDWRSKENHTFTHYTVKDGLSDAFVMGVLEDDQGYLWSSTGYGIARFDPENAHFLNYYQSHGLPGNIHNRTGHLKTSKGEMVFGSTQGLTIFSPEKIFNNKTPPSIVFTDFRLANKSQGINTPDSPLKQSISVAKSVSLNSQQRVFSLTFAALNYRMSGMNQYAYKLEGFDSEWTYSGTKRSATYTNLDPGEYVFRVVGANNEGVWSESGAELVIRILPPWWRTWWAYSAYVLFVAGFMCLIVYTILNKKQTEKERQLNIQLKNMQGQLVHTEKMSSLSTLVAGLVHEINNPSNMTQISAHNIDRKLKDFKAFLIDLTGDGNSEVVAVFEEKFDHFASDLSAMQEGNARIKDLVESFRLFARLDEHGFKYDRLEAGIRSCLDIVKACYGGRIDVRCDVLDDPEVFCHAGQLNQVFMNLMINACQAMVDKQGTAGKLLMDKKGVLSVVVRKSKTSLIVTITDNGCGMSDDTLKQIFEPFFTTRVVGDGVGLGLSIAFGIVERHKGRIEVTSAVGEGSTFSVIVPSGAIR